MQPVAAHADSGTPASGLTTSGPDVTRPGRAVAAHGDTLAWTVDYDNAGTGARAPVTITDPVQSAGAAQTCIPGSLHVLPCWAAAWSTDGTSCTGTDQGAAATVAVRASDPWWRRQDLGTR